MYNESERTDASEWGQCVCVSVRVRVGERLYWELMYCVVRSAYGIGSDRTELLLLFSFRRGRGSV